MKKILKIDDLYLSEKEQAEYDLVKKPKVAVRNEGENASSFFQRRLPYTASKINTAIGDLRFKDLLDFLNTL